MVLIRNIKGEIALPISLCISVFLIGCSISVISPIIDALRRLESTTGEKYLSVMLKSLGIALMTSMSGELCRESGESVLASRTELLGKCIILALAEPLIEDIINMTREIAGL